MPVSREVPTGCLDVSHGTNVTSGAVSFNDALRTRFRGAITGLSLPLDRFNPILAGASRAIPFSNQATSPHLTMQFETPDLSALLPVLISAAPSAILIIIGAIVLNLVMGRALVMLARRTSFTEQEVLPIRRSIKWVITIAALVFVLGAFGLNVGGMWGILSTVLAMVAIGFVAVWSVLSNTLCTLIIMVFRPFAVGDEIEFPKEDVKGRVIDLNIFYTTLDAGEGILMQVPNNLFFQKVLRRKRAARAVSLSMHMRTKRPDSPDPLPADAEFPASRA